MRDFIFDDLHDMLTGFGTPRDIAFNVNDTLDMRPAKWEKLAEENGYRCVCRTVGINEKDVKIELNNRFISVSGNSEYEGIKYNVRYNLPLSEEIISNITGIKYKSLNGITYIYVYTNKPDIRKIVAERID